MNFVNVASCSINAVFFFGCRYIEIKVFSDLDLYF